MIDKGKHICELLTSLQPNKRCRKTNFLINETVLSIFCIITSSLNKMKVAKSFFFVFSKGAFEDVVKCLNEYKQLKTNWIHYRLSQQLLWCTFKKRKKILLFLLTTYRLSHHRHSKNTHHKLVLPLFIYPPRLLKWN